MHRFFKLSQQTVLFRLLKKHFEKKKSQINDRTIPSRNCYLEKKDMRKGAKVHWNWGKSQAEGKIVEKSEKTIRKKIKGTEVKRKASKEEPSYVIKQANGNEVVKSESELTEGGKEK